MNGLTILEGVRIVAVAHDLKFTVMMYPSCEVVLASLSVLVTSIENVYPSRELSVVII